MNMIHNAQKAARWSVVIAVVASALVFLATSTETVGSIYFPLYDPALWAGMVILGNVHSPNFVVVFIVVFLENYLISFVALLLYLIGKQVASKEA